jgi:hypothetical protein
MTTKVFGVRQTAGDVEVNDTRQLTTWSFHGCNRGGDLFGAVRPTLNPEPGDDYQASLSPAGSTPHVLVDEIYHGGGEVASP